MLKFNKEDLKDKKLITKAGILEHYSDYDIFRKYCGVFTIGHSFISPLRDERNPSFSIFESKRGELIFNDYLGYTGDFVTFVQKKFTLNYHESLIKIVKDFNLEKHFYFNDNLRIVKDYTIPVKYTRPKITGTVIQKKSRPWEPHDLRFWKLVGISPKTLKTFNVEPISHVFLNGVIAKADKYAYCLTEFKDEIETYTIYQPFNKEHKWKKSHDASVWYGWNQLPKEGNQLIITKSAKDVMSLHENLKIPVTSLQNEKTMPKHNVIAELYSRFNVIYLLYDNDFDKETNWGEVYGKELADKFAFIQLSIPNEFKSKDFTDLIKNYTVEIAVKIIQEEMQNAVPF